MDPQEFANAIGAENLGKFEDIVAKLSPEQRGQVAYAFSVDASTVDRWAESPNNAPESVTKWQVVRWISRFINKN